MKENEMIYDISAELEQEFGPKGSATRKAAEEVQRSDTSGCPQECWPYPAGTGRKDWCKQGLCVTFGAWSYHPVCFNPLSHCRSNGLDSRVTSYRIAFHDS